MRIENRGKNPLDNSTNSQEQQKKRRGSNSSQSSPPSDQGKIHIINR